MKKPMTDAEKRSDMRRCIAEYCSRMKEAAPEEIQPIEEGTALAEQPRSDEDEKSEARRDYYCFFA